MNAQTQQAKLGKVEIRVVEDDGPDTSYLEQEGFEDRLDEYRNGHFTFVGVAVRAQVLIPYGKDTISTYVESPGLWGIESDSGEDYFRSVAEDELDTLRDMLLSLSVSMGEIDPAALEMR